MKTLIVKKSSEHIGQNCRLCAAQIKVGQSIVVDTVTELRFGSGRVRRHHTKCLRILLADAPAGVDEIEDLRNRILEAGTPYVAA